MKKQKNKRLASAKESLEDILKKISPYMPKPKNVKQSEPPRWKLVSNGELPPLNSTAQ